MLLKYSVSEIEPHMMKRTIEIMERAILQQYQITFDAEERDTDSPEVILQGDMNTLPNQLRHVSGGIYNFHLFLPILQPSPSAITYPDEESNLGKYISTTWAADTYVESFRKMYTDVNKKATSHLGPGWIFLTYNTKREKLHIVALDMNDNPLCYAHESGVLRIPLFAWNLWEHAYYIQYEYRRNSYIKNLWYITDWSVIEKRFDTVFDTKRPLKLDELK